MVSLQPLTDYLPRTPNKLKSIDIHHAVKDAAAPAKCDDGAGPLACRHIERVKEVPRGHSEGKSVFRKVAPLRACKLGRRADLDLPAATQRLDQNDGRDQALSQYL